MIISNCINLIKIGVNNNKKGFIIQNNKKNLGIIRAFIKINIISFITVKNKSITAYINYNNNKPLFKNILNLFKPSHKKFITLKELKKLNKKHNWILILSTSKGILNSFEAINIGVGGLLLAKIWN